MLDLIDESHLDTDYSAFTVAELGEMLPERDKNDRQYVTIKGDNEWLAWETEEGLYDNRGNYILAKTEADARAKMIIYLIENKLVKVEDINKEV